MAFTGGTFQGAKMYDFQINEIFYSIQGEGKQVGIPAIFVRLAGCNLKCSWCDTPNHIEVNLTLSYKQLYDEISRLSTSCKNIVFTGGEPLLQQLAIIKFVEQFNFNYFVETNGTVEPLDLLKDQIFWTVSPKQLKRINDWLPWADAVKLVYSKETNPAKKAELLTKLSLISKTTPVYIQPLEIDGHYNFDECIDFIKENPEWKLSIQTHKLLNIR